MDELAVLSSKIGHNCSFTVNLGISGLFLMDRRRVIGHPEGQNRENKKKNKFSSHVHAAADLYCDSLTGCNYNWPTSLCNICRSGGHKQLVNAMGEMLNQYWIVHCIVPVEELRQRRRSLREGKDMRDYLLTNISKRGIISCKFLSFFPISPEA